MEVLGLAFIYFIDNSLSAKRASLNCLFNDAVSVLCVFVVCRSSVVWFGRCAETTSLLSAKQTTQHLIVGLH